MRKIRDQSSSRNTYLRSIVCRMDDKTIYRRWLENGKRKLDFIQKFIKFHDKVLSRTSLYKILKAEDNTVKLVNLELSDKEHHSSTKSKRNHRNTVNVSFPSVVRMDFYTDVRNCL